MDNKSETIPQTVKHVKNFQRNLEIIRAVRKLKSGVLLIMIGGVGIYMTNSAVERFGIDTSYYLYFAAFGGFVVFGLVFLYLAYKKYKEIRANQ